MIAGRMTFFRLLAISGLLLTCLAGYVRSAAANATCGGSDALTCDENLYCEKNTCKVKADGNCTADPADQCIMGATCVGMMCKCGEDYTPNANMTMCSPVAKKVGGTCSSGDGTSACDDGNAECTTSKCLCKTGYTAVPSTLTCQSKSNAPKATLSSLLLFLGLLLTSRLA